MCAVLGCAYLPALAVYPPSLLSLAVHISQNQGVLRNRCSRRFKLRKQRVRQVVNEKDKRQAAEPVLQNPRRNLLVLML